MIFGVAFIGCNIFSPFFLPGIPMPGVMRKIAGSYAARDREKCRNTSLLLPPLHSARMSTAGFPAVYTKSLRDAPACASDWHSVCEDNGFNNRVSACSYVREHAAMCALCLAKYLCVCV